jgi:glyoxylate reductase
MTLYAKTLGIIGMGEIGQEVARRARAFEMEVVYYKRHKLTAQQEAELGIRYLPLSELLKRSDYVSLHVPHTPETEHMIGKRELKMMKHTAFLVNTSRGGVVDEDALGQVLTGKTIAGAGLDVFTEEPLPETSPLLSAPNTVLTPHIAGGEEEELKIRPICDNILRVAEGRKAVNIVR